MVKSTITITCCDVCGAPSMTGDDIRTVTVSLPGKMSRAFSYEFCADCVERFRLWVTASEKSSAPIEVQL